MASLMKLAGYGLFCLLCFLVFLGISKQDPDPVTVAKAMPLFGIALAMIAIGYLGDIRDAINESDKRLDEKIRNALRDQ